MTHRPPHVFTSRPDQLHLLSWATSPCGYGLRARPVDPVYADGYQWHRPRLAVVDIAVLDLIADWWGDRTHDDGFTLAVGLTGEEAELTEARGLDRVDFALRVDTLSGLTAVRRLLNQARHHGPEHLRYLLAGIGPASARSSEQRIHPTR